MRSRSIAVALFLVWAALALPASPQQTRAAKTSLLGRDDGLAVISSALDAHTRLASKTDCSHLVHAIYARAGFSYDYASSSDLYDGNVSFRRVKHPQPGDLIVWPGHVGIVVNPAQHSFYSALTTGLGVDAYDSHYWKQRGKPRFLRYLKSATQLSVTQTTRSEQLGTKDE
jgi:cell wall-associated NlpC family hydrolase